MYIVYVSSTARRRVVVPATSRGLATADGDALERTNNGATTMMSLGEAGEFTASIALRAAETLEFVLIVKTYDDLGVTEDERRFAWLGTDYDPRAAVAAPWRVRARSTHIR